MKKKIGIVCIVVIIIAVNLGIVLIKRSENNTIDNKISVTIEVFNKEGENIYNKSIDTDKKYLLEVINDTKELNIVTEDSQYGAYVTSVMGIEQGDNYYWSYYIDGEYATVGVSSCEIQEGKKYDFKIEKMNY